MEKRTSIVLGLGFGDEGKGSTVDYLCPSFYSAVVRFSGGHQAGHTVIRNGKRHVFSQFGSATLVGTPTFWSRYCTLYPVGMVAEHKALIALDIKPEIYVDHLSPVTTFYDVFYNRALEKANGHGSCGVGFAATIERNETPAKLYAQDLIHKNVLKLKLESIKKYYENKVRKTGDYMLQKEYFSFDEEKGMKLFFEACEYCSQFVKLIAEGDFFDNPNFRNFIFEGSQGILLDMDFGFFPHVTRANTTSKNALQIIQRNNLEKPEIYYITRAYQTRHGNGPMTNEGLLKNINFNKKETNVKNEWQGNFRTGLLDLDLINHALTCDNNYSAGCKKNIVITCLDQIIGDVIATKGGNQFEIKDWKKDFIDKLNTKFDYFHLRSDEENKPRSGKESEVTIFSTYLLENELYANTQRN